MKNIIFFMFGILTHILCAHSTSASGPFPMPYSYHTYPTNPANKMTPQTRYAVQQAFLWAQGAFQQNHSVCRNRNECLSFDLQSLQQYIQRNPNHPATQFFQDIYNIIRHDAAHQKFVSEWVIFQNLSPARQMEFRNGLRVTPVRPQYVVTPSGAVTPAFFNLDDVLTDLLQEIDHDHRSCELYNACLQRDLLRVNNMYSRLTAGDPARLSLSNLYQNIVNISSSARNRFDTNLYLNLYNPISTSWYDLSRKYKARKQATYGYYEWKKIEKTSRPTSWHAPRYTNGRTIPPTPYSYPVRQYPPVPQGSVNPSQNNSWYNKATDWLWRNSNLRQRIFGH